MSDSHPMPEPTEIRTLTPAQFIKLHDQGSDMPRKPRKAIHWIKASSGIEIGPFIEEADARLARSALELFREDLQWTVTNENEKGRNQ